MRCLVRDPRGLGDQRVRVQIALGDLADPASFRNALRGVDTVVHLAASIRDQPRASIEELNAVATLRLVRAAERAGAQRFVFFSALGAAPPLAHALLPRQGAGARRRWRRRRSRRRSSGPRSSTRPGDPWLTLLERFSLAAGGAGVGLGAGALPADLGRGRGRLRGGRAANGGPRRRSFELAGPGDALLRRHRAHGRCARSAAAGRCCTCRCPVVRASLGRCERLAGPNGLRHLGGGGADGGADDHAARHRRRARRSASRRCRWRACWARPRARND